MCLWRDVITGSSVPISSIRNLFSPYQQEIASTGKQIVMVGRPEVLSQSLQSFRYRLSVLSVVYQKSLNVSRRTVMLTSQKFELNLLQYSNSCVPFTVQLSL